MVVLHEVRRPYGVFSHRGTGGVGKAIGHGEDFFESLCLGASVRVLKVFLIGEIV